MCKAYIMNRMGLRMLSWGTPAFIGWNVEFTVVTNASLSAKK